MKGNHSSTRIFEQTDVAPTGRSLFDLSHRKLLSCDFGQLIPIMCESVIPGDYWKIGAQLLARFNPMVAPMMHEVNMFVHSFFVPHRLLWPKPNYTDPTDLEDGTWEGFVTGGVDGDNADIIPLWNVSGSYTGALHSLWDYFGFPTGIAVPHNSLPHAFPKRAYNLIFNEFYRDETLIDPVDLDQDSVLYRCWEKDYFTSALLGQQRGTAPALPVQVTGSAVFPDSAFSNADGGAGNRPLSFYHDANQNPSIAKPIGTILTPYWSENAKRFFNNNTLDAEAVTFDVADLRLVFQVQKFLERNNRSGVRYTEFLGAHFGVHPRDDRLQRPEYIGGIKNPIIVSEVLQTSATDSQPTPQGNMAGHGIAVDQSFVGSYKVQEFGIIVSILSIMPRSMYMQGIDRQWSYRTKYDYYFPEFAHLSEQGIENGELFIGTDDAVNHQLFGYQGRYDEHRFKRSMVTSDFRSTFDYWHLARKFSSLPSLNQQFVQMSAAENVELKRVFADQADNGILVSVGNIIQANRPMPAMPLPGFIDH